ncbi:MAG: 16S rRNA (adenine(1518)-N(6)/adenine(1519)-N(6))-dimethyltransferase RsmA [Myxococcota bacterium]|nr:16S rRNA (adenine(1518)-N(6)/adenine(1519)-N(6))-dimethyltransferase RsmA [Myxococcota bacterium]
MSFHDPRKVLKAHGVWTKKQFGQNFLINPAIPDQIVMAGGVSANDVVFEIGAGCGTLTRALATVGCPVVALEYDRELVPIARAELAWAPHVELREGNVLDVDWRALADELGQPLTVYGNLPYHLSSAIIFSLLEQGDCWERACFLLQKEFAQRLSATPGTRQSSALTVNAALHAQSTLIFDVAPTAFHPPPKVHSSVVVMERHAEPPVDVGVNRQFRAIVRNLFEHRRKMTRKALKALAADSARLLDEAGIDGTRRGETLNLREIAALSRALGRVDAKTA